MMNFEQFNFPSRRSNVIGFNGLVATSQPLAAQVGLDVLKAGGNAIDAAIATVATLCVVEPCSTGIGGDAFALIWSARDKKLYGLNASGPAPEALTAVLNQYEADEPAPPIFFHPPSPSQILRASLFMMAVCLTVAIWML